MLCLVSEMFRTGKQRNCEEMCREGKARIGNEERGRRRERKRHVTRRQSLEMRSVDGKGCAER